MKDDGNIRDEELDKILKPLRDEAKVSNFIKDRWCAAVELESQERKSHWQTGQYFPEWRDILKVAAGIFVGIGIASAYIQRQSQPMQRQENVLASATVQYLSAKAVD